MAIEKLIKTYDPALCTVQVNNVFITGHSETGIVSIEKNEDDATTHVGAKGAVTYSKNNDNTATCTLYLMQTSPQLPMLRELAVAGETFNLTIIDQNDTGKNISVDECIFLKRPDINVLKEQEDLEIEIFIPYLDV